MISKIERPNLVDEAYKQIRDNIVNDVWHEGEKILSESQLCNLLNVSRGVVREALQRLRIEKLIVTHQGMGSFVANPRNFTKAEDADSQASLSSQSYEDFQNIMEFRACIECEAIKCAVSRASDEELQAVLRIAHEMERSQDDLAAFTQADYRFHMEILRCSKNDMYAQAMESFAPQVQFCLNSMNQLNDARKWAVKLHYKIAECLCRRDAKKAIDLLKRNGEYNLARMGQFYEVQPDEKEGSPNIKK